MLIQMLHALLPTSQRLIQVIHLGSDAAFWCLHAWRISPVLSRIRCSIMFLELPFFFMEVSPSVLYIIWFIWFHSLVLHQDSSMFLSSQDALDNQAINTRGTTAVLKNTGRLEHQWFAIFAMTLINQSRIKCVCVCVLSRFSHVWLCDSMDYSPPGSSVLGIFQARILEWVSISFFRWSSWPRDQTHISYVSCIGRRVLYH